LAVKINGNRGVQPNENFKRSRTISTGIPNLGVWCKKWSNWTSGVGVGQTNPTPTPSVVRNLTPTPAKNLRLRHPDRKLEYYAQNGNVGIYIPSGFKTIRDPMRKLSILTN